MFENEHSDNIDYVIITPVPSAKMQLDLRHALNSFYQNYDIYPKKDRKKLGGTQAQNVSDLNAKFAGMNDLLFADLSFTLKHKDDLQKAILSKKSILNEVKMDDKKYKIILNEIIHFKAENSFEMAVMDYLIETLSKVIDIHANFNDYDFSNASENNSIYFKKEKREESQEMIYNHVLNQYRKNQVSPSDDMKNTIKKSISKITDGFTYE